MKRRRIIYTDEAGTDLKWIYDTIAEAGDPVTASRYEQRIRAVARRWTSLPSGEPAATTFAKAYALSASSGA